jgi:pimeloyl-ACP methyl ester carboxylesterase
MPIKSIQRYLRRVQRQTGSTIKYMRLALEGNRVDRLTNFSKLKKPILLLHGYGGTRRVFQVLENRLRHDGFSVFSLNLGGIFDTFNTKPIPQLARLVAKKIDSLYKRYDIREKLTIIGHSKGGLIGRCYIKEFGGQRRVKTLITMGTPHHGNPWAMLGLLTPLALLTESIRQMTPMSPFIRRMNRTPWPKGLKIVSIYSKIDSLCPYPSAVLKPHGNLQIKNIEVRDVTHSEFLLKKRVYWLIRKELLEGTTSAERSQLRRKKRRASLSNKSKELARQELSANHK